MDFDREELRRTLADLPRRCGAVGATATIELEGLHFARVECESCGTWLEWLAWPKERPSERRRKRRRVLSSEEHCELCLRHETELPGDEVLKEHHVVAWEHGGSDDPSNLRVYCPACHAFVEWSRTYFGHYHLEAV